MSILLVLGATAFMIFAAIVKKMPKIRALAAAISGIGFAVGDVGGLLSRLLLRVAGFAVHTEDTLSGRLFSAGAALVGLVIVATMAGFWVHDMWPKHAAKMRTTILGLVTPFVAVATGGQAASLVHSFNTSIGNTGIGGAWAPHIIIIATHIGG